MPDIRRLRELIKPSHTNRGDGMSSTTHGVSKHTDNYEAISSIIIAIQMISTYCKKLKYKREIVLVTNGNGAMNNEGLDQIQKKITDDNIKLTVLWVALRLSYLFLLISSRGPDFDDAEYGVKEEDKEFRKVKSICFIPELLY